MTLTGSLVALLVGCFVFGSAQSAGGGGAAQSLDQESLQRLAQQMSQQLKQIAEAQAAGFGASQALPGWVDPAAWQKVSKGMTPDHVRKLLGPPATTRTVGSLEVWSYGAPASGAELRAEDVVGQVSFQGGVVAEANSNPQRLESTRRRLGAGGQPPQPAGGTSAAEGKSSATAPEPWKSKATWKSIREGMSANEVRGILGPPTKEFAVGESVMQWVYGDLQAAMTPSSSVRVMGSVEFHDGHVESSSCWEIPAVQTSPPVVTAGAPESKQATPAQTTAAPAEPTIAPPPNGVPGYFIEARWLALQPGMSGQAVIALLGRPKRSEGNRWIYSIGEQQVGLVDFANDKAGYQSHDSRIVQALEALSGAAGDTVPKWLNPKHWAILEDAEAADLKRGVPLSKVQELLGESTAQQPGADYQNRPITTRYYRATDASGYEVIGAVAIDEFGETAGIRPPDWAKAFPAIKQMMADSAAGPVWRDTERWRRLCWALEAERQAAWASALPDEATGGLEDSLKGMRLADPAVRDRYMSGKPTIEWSEVPDGFGAKEWCAKVQYSSGLTILVGTGQAGGAAPQIPEHPYLKRVVAKPTPLVQPSQKRHPAWSDAQWKELLAADGEREASVLAGLMMRLQSLEMSRSNVVLSVAKSIGKPDEVRVEPDPSSFTTSPSTDEVGNYRVSLRFGTGVIQYVARLGADGRRAIQSSPELIHGISPAVAQVIPPAESSEAATSDGRGWPVYATPMADDLPRWKLVESGDSVRWVKRLLGEPTSKQVLRAGRDSAENWTYGPWPEKRLHSGIVAVEKGVRTAGGQAPTE